MIQIEIGDIIDCKGVELEVWAVKFHYAANGVSGEVTLVDPLVAAQWREELEAKKRQTRMFSSGLVNSVLQKSDKAMDGGGEQP